MSPRGGSKEPGARRRALNDRLLSELRRMQDDLDSMTERYRVRVGGTLNELITRLDGDPSLDQPSRLATLRTAQAMLDEIAAAKVRTRKARAKDLDRFERLVRKLADIDD